MAFYLYTGNRLEDLVEKNLCGSVLDKPLTDPFRTETIVVQSLGMAAWLKQEIAEHKDIAANISFPFLNNFIDEVLEKTLSDSMCPNKEYFKIESMTWRLFEILSKRKEEFPELKSYISGSNYELKQFQLAERIASSFDQYQIYRPDLIIQWESSKSKTDHNWQAELWRELAKNRVSRSRGLVNFLEHADLTHLEYERVSIIGISTMPAIYLEFFQKLGRSLPHGLTRTNTDRHGQLKDSAVDVCCGMPDLSETATSESSPSVWQKAQHPEFAVQTDVHFFYLNPSADDWQFNLSQKEENQLLRKLVQNSSYNEEDYLNEGNQLLSAFGRVGREFFSTVLEATEYNDQPNFIDPGKNTILSTLQHDILNNIDSENLDLPHDNSVQIHNCHSQMREVEVLYDNLLQMIKGSQEPTPYSHTDGHGQTRTNTDAEDYNANTMDNDKGNLSPQQTPSAKSSNSPCQSVSVRVRPCGNKPQPPPNVSPCGDKIHPRDIVVITPDISSYAPYIHAVFDRRNNELNPYRETLSYSLSDVKIAQNSKIIETFFNILNLKDSKFRANEILDILETEAVCSAFNIDDKNLEIIRKWIKESGMRWGIDAAHRSKLNLPSFSENSITSGLDSLLLGYAMESPYQKILTIPYNEIEISESNILGKFSRFLHSLFKLEKILFETNSIEDWITKLTYIINTFFVSNNDTFKDIALLRKAIKNLEDSILTAEFKTKLSIDVIKSFLFQKLDNETINEVFLRGKITFCTMLPMRSIPAKVICILGMNDGVFPRQERKLGFNILNNEIRICDRSKRFEDYYLFLESILTARNILYISYIGQDVSTNELSPPAPPVCELIDYLSNLSPENFVTKHKLQAFHHEYFNNNKKLFSFSKTDCNSAKTLTKEQIKRKIFENETATRLRSADAELRRGAAKHTTLRQAYAGQAKDTRIVLLTELFSFFKNPSRTAIKEGVGASLSIRHNLIEDVEPIEIIGLEKYSINQKIIEALITGRPIEELYHRLKHEGNLPVGRRGKLLFEQQATNIEMLYNNESEGLGSPKKLLANTSDLDIKIDFPNTQLSATIHHIKDDKQVYFQVAPVTGKRIIEVWIKHLLFVASGNGKTTYCFIGDNLKGYYSQKCPDISKEESIRELYELIEIYIDGLQSPIPFFPNTSYEYITAKKDNDDAARKKFLGDYRSRGEIEDPYISLCFDENVLKSQEFKEYSKRIFKYYCANNSYHHTDEHGLTQTNTDSEDSTASTVDNTNVNLSPQQAPSAESSPCPSVSVRVRPCRNGPSPSSSPNSSEKKTK